MKIGFTGTEYRGSTQGQREQLIFLLMDLAATETHHGDCVGCDADFHEVCLDLQIPSIVIHPPQNHKKRAFCVGKNVTILREEPYLKRNRDIVNSTELLIACPFEDYEVLRSGVWSTFRYAKQKYKRIYVIYPNGKVERRS